MARRSGQNHVSEEPENVGVGRNETGEPVFVKIADTVEEPGPEQEASSEVTEKAIPEAPVAPPVSEPVPEPKPTPAPAPEPIRRTPPMRPVPPTQSSPKSEAPEKTDAQKYADIVKNIRDKGAFTSEDKIFISSLEKKNTEFSSLESTDLPQKTIENSVMFDFLKMASKEPSIFTTTETVKLFNDIEKTGVGNKTESLDALGRVAEQIEHISGAEKKAILDVLRNSVDKTFIERMSPEEKAFHAPILKEIEQNSPLKDKTGPDAPETEKGDVPKTEAEQAKEIAESYVDALRRFSASEAATGLFRSFEQEAHERSERAGVASATLERLKNKPVKEDSPGVPGGKSGMFAGLMSAIKSSMNGGDKSRKQAQEAIDLFSNFGSPIAVDARDTMLKSLQRAKEREVEMDTLAEAQVKLHAKMESSRKEIYDISQKHFGDATEMFNIMAEAKEKGEEPKFPTPEMATLAQEFEKDMAASKAMVDKSVLIREEAADDMAHYASAAKFLENKGFLNAHEKEYTQAGAHELAESMANVQESATNNGLTSQDNEKEEGLKKKMKEALEQMEEVVKNMVQKIKNLFTR